MKPSATRVAQRFLEAAGKYIWREMKKGDYWGPGMASSRDLVRSMANNAKRIKTGDEYAHFEQQVLYAESARSITKEQATELRLIANRRS